MPVTHLSLSPDGTRLAAAVGSAVFVIPLAKGVPHVAGRHAGRISALAFAANGRLISASVDGQVVVRDLAAGNQQVGSFLVPKDATLAIARNGERIAIASGGRIEVRTVADGKVIHTTQLRGNVERSVADGGPSAKTTGTTDVPPGPSPAAPDQSGVEAGPAGSASGPAGVEVGPPAEASEQSGMAANSPAATSDQSGVDVSTAASPALQPEVIRLFFSDNGKTVAASIAVPYAGPYSDESIIWNLSSGAFETIKGNVYGISPNGQSVVIHEQYGGAVQETYHEAITLHGLANGARWVRDVLFLQALTFRPDGRVMALGRETETELWDVATGRRAGSLDVHGTPVAFLGGGKLLVMLDGQRIVFVDTARKGTRRAELELSESGGWLARTSGEKIEAGGGFETQLRWHAGDAWYPLAAPLTPAGGSVLAEALALGAKEP